jgi:ubiquitin-large subunit ribosomal protein L40e
MDDMTKQTELRKIPLIMRANGMMNINVITLTGTCLPVEVSPNEEVESMMQRIYEYEGIPVSQQKIIYQGKKLEPGHLISEYDV